MNNTLPAPLVTFVFAALLLARAAVQLWLLRRQARCVAQHRGTVPTAFAATIDLPAHQKAADYTLARVRLALLALPLEAAVLLGWTLFGVVWGAAVVGIVLNSVDLEKFRKPSVVCYIAMGWVIVIAIRPLLEKMDALCLWLLVAGGVFYTVGVIFYAIKKVRYFHSVWHIFVLMGSLCHYLSILFAILP